MTQAKESTLKNYVKKINFGTEERLPMIPGGALFDIMRHYKIPAIRWGYNGTLIGIETKKQFLFWRWIGSACEFKGLLNKDQGEC
jgi:hypothetical protein